MMIRTAVALLLSSGTGLAISGCGGGGTPTSVPTVPVAYVLTVNSATPASGVAITISPKDNNGAGNGSTSFTRTYNTGTAITLTAPSTAGSNTFSSWSGCTSASSVTCNVTLAANTTVTASYTSPAAGVAYYVSGSGSDSNNGLSANTPFLTLQHAAGVTQPGDTVYAMNGTYTNSCASCSVLDISTPGTPNAWITYKAYPGQTPTISFNGWEGVFFEPAAAYVEVNGFTIVGNNAHVTLAEAQAQSLTTPDPAFNGNCVASDGRKGTDTVRPNHIRILNNIIGECGGGGVSTAMSDYVTISGNTIYNASWYSIYGTSPISTWEDWNSDSSTNYKMIVTGNRIFGNQEFIPWEAAGKITDGEGVIVDSTRNSAYQSSIPIAPYTGRTLIANNVIYTNGSSAIEVFESDHVDVVNNSSYQDIVTPVLTGRGEMNLNQTSDVNVINNIFSSAAGQNPVTVTPGTTSLIVLNYNLYFGGTNTGDVPNGANDLVGDPLYVDPADSNPLDVLLSVSSSSPVVGSGTSHLAPATDFSGNPRPGSKGYDRGAYQQQ